MKPYAKILIIEDNPDLLQIARMSFEADGFLVDSSDNGINGVVQIVSFQPDIILLDVMMPQMDGFEVLQAIRYNSSVRVPIVVASNLGQQKDIDRAYELGADAYLQKSNYSPEDMVHFVKDVLEKKRKEEK